VLTVGDASSTSYSGWTSGPGAFEQLGTGTTTLTVPGAPQRAGEDSAREREKPSDHFHALLKLAIDKLAACDAPTALAAASEACHCAPKDRRAHYVYGQAWLALNEPGRAEQAFAAALQLMPDWADAWINYGIARYRQGHLDDAKTAMRQALLRVPGHPAATANLGAFMRISGESEGGEALLRETVARAPGNVAARLNLVADLLQAERAVEALALLDQANPPANDPPAVRHWHLQRALALLQLKRAAEARNALNAFTAPGPCPPEQASLLHWRLVLLALAENDPARAVTEAERMEAALAAADAPILPEHRIMGHFDLAKFWSGCNAYPRAFRHWVDGHALLRPSQPFSRQVHAAFIDATIAAFGRARFGGPRASDRDPAPVFIVGMPRAGTTLCEQILAAHRDVHGAGERTALGRAFGALGGKGDDPASPHRVASLHPSALDAAAARYRAELHALAQGKARIVDKMPGNYNYLGLVGLMLPGAKIIHCVRDPRDIGLSIFTFRFHGHHPYAHDLGDLGWAIAQQARLMEHWRGVLPNPVLTVKLADWVEDFDGTLARVLAHLDLPPDPNCARFYESDSRVRTVSYAQVRQPVNARGLGRWRRYAEALAPLIAELEAGGALAGWRDG
jgi:Flp pilus assembly protein TadD